MLLQIRLTNGQALTQTFSAKEPLAAVRVYIETNRTDGSGPFSLMTNFPKKIFQGDDFEKPLDVLGMNEHLHDADFFFFKFFKMLTWVVFLLYWFHLWTINYWNANKTKIFKGRLLRIWSKFNFVYVGMSKTVVLNYNINYITLLFKSL